MRFRWSSVFIYALLVGGSVVFVWPFLWMATTSVKLDREVFSDTPENVSLWPQRPIPRVRSPYIDERFYENVSGKRMREMLPVIEEHLRKMQFAWPDDVDRETAIKQVARGIYKKLKTVLP